MNSKKDSKTSLEQKKSKDEEKILDCTKEIEEYMEKVIPKEDEDVYAHIHHLI